MAKYAVKSIFKDGQTGKLHIKDEVIDITEERAKTFPAGLIEKVATKANKKADTEKPAE